MKKYLTLFVCLISIFVFSVSSFAVTYSNDYPTYLPISGGAYFEVQCSLGKVSLVFPDSFKNGTFGFSGSGSDIVNLTNSTVQGYLYTSSGASYSARLTRLSTLEYQPSSSSSTWSSITVSQIYNTNVTFIDLTSRDRQTDNYYLSKEDMFLYSFVILNTVFSLFILLSNLFRGKK